MIKVHRIVLEIAADEDEFDDPNDAATAAAETFSDSTAVSIVEATTVYPTRTPKK